MKHDIAFLHTSPVHVPAFESLMREVAPGLRAAHFVHADLLADEAVRGGGRVRVAAALVVRAQASRAPAAGLLAAAPKQRH